MESMRPDYRSREKRREKKELESSSFIKGFNYPFGGENQQGARLDAKPVGKRGANMFVGNP